VYKEREAAVSSWIGYENVRAANKRLLEDHLGSLASFGAHIRSLSDQGMLDGSLC
jgi:hypothetical protein